MDNPEHPSRPVTEAASLTDRLLSWLQVPLPHHLLSRIIFRLLRITWSPVKQLQIRLVTWLYRIDLDEAANPDPGAYPHFNAFFTRALAEGARPVVSGDGELACPVDGVVSQVGSIRGSRIFQAKGRDYSLVELLGGSSRRAEPFADGTFATLYLSPRDYHRVHMPVDGELSEMIHVPGRLFSVNPGTTRVVPRIFARNERVIALFETELGAMALVLVGALFVAAIETAWAGLVTPPAGRRLAVHRYGGETERRVVLDRGEEMGRFNMGSTVIVLLGPGRVDWAPGLAPETPVRMGQLLARARSGAGSS